MCKALLLTERTKNPGQCCTASRPFTRSLRARTARRNDVYGFDSRRCGGRAALVRRCDSGNCCYRMPGTANVAAQWFRGGGAAADQADQAEQAEQAEVIQSRDDDKDNNNTEQEECIEPDYFMFFDSEGNQHEIRIPEGKYQEATEHYVKGEWENLTAYPAWSE